MRHSQCWSSCIYNIVHITEDSGAVNKLLICVYSYYRKYYYHTSTLQLCKLHNHDIINQRQSWTLGQKETHFE